MKSTLSRAVHLNDKIKKGELNERATKASGLV